MKQQSAPVLLAISNQRRLSLVLPADQKKVLVSLFRVPVSYPNRMDVTSVRLPGVMLSTVARSEDVPCDIERSTSMSTCSEADALIETHRKGLFSPCDVQAAGALNRLPDEIISCCMLGLSADDMASLERVSQRMKHVVQNDSQRWRDVVMQRWSTDVSEEVLQRAYDFAGSWKRLYAEKITNEKANAPWRMPCASEMDAILDIIQGRRHTYDPADPMSQLTRSPLSVLSSSSGMSDDELSVSPPTASNMVPQAMTNASPDTEMGDAVATQDTLDLAAVVLIDGSSSVTEDDFRAMRSFSRSLVCALRESHREASVAVVQFNQFPRVELPLTNVRSPGPLQLLEELEQMMGSTDIAAPVKRAAELLDGVLARDKLILLLSDGQTHTEELRQTEMHACKAADQQRARVFTLGVGRDVDEAGLGRVANSARNAHANRLQQSSTAVNGCYFALRKYAKKVC